MKASQASIEAVSCVGYMRLEVEGPFRPQARSKRKFCPDNRGHLRGQTVGEAFTISRLKACCAPWHHHGDFKHSVIGRLRKTGVHAPM